MPRRSLDPQHLEERPRPQSPQGMSASPLTEETFFVMARASAYGSSDANEALGELGLKVRQYSALVLASADAPPTQRELSQFLALDPSQIVAIVDSLEKRGAVERRPDPRDRRSKIIVATEAGRELCAQARLVVDGATRSSLHTLTEAEQEQLHELLVRVAFSRG